MFITELAIMLLNLPTGYNQLANWVSCSYNCVIGSRITLKVIAFLQKSEYVFAVLAVAAKRSRWQNKWVLLHSVGHHERIQNAIICFCGAEGKQINYMDGFNAQQMCQFERCAQWTNIIVSTYTMNCRNMNTLVPTKRVRKQKTNKFGSEYVAN